MNFHAITIADIVIERDSRQRREIETSDLEKSISRLGLLSPIIVNRKGNILVAGERRLEACRKLGWTSIACRYFDELSQLESAILEYEENNKRKALTWQEDVSAVSNIHQMFLTANESWTQAQTADELGLSKGHVSLCLIVAQHLSDERIIKCQTSREAWNILRRREQRKAGDALQQLLSDEPPINAALANESKPRQEIHNRNVSPTVSSSVSRNILPKNSSILNADFLTWAPQYSGPKFNFLHCDFPYGVNNNISRQGQQGEPNFFYNDSRDTFFDLLDCLCENFWKLMSVSSHVMFWYSKKYESEIIAKFSRIPAIQFAPHALVWHKTDNHGIVSDARRWPRHTYEKALLLMVGERQILKSVSDSIGRPTDPKLHPSCKPEPMLGHFFQMFVDGQTRMLDPTCGSGSALRAADALGAKEVIGIELNSEMAHIADVALDNARKLRGVKL